MQVGSSVVDMPQGAETTMKKANLVAVTREYERFNSSSIQYEIDFKAATIKAEQAKTVVDDARKKKILAITAVAATAIAVAAVVAAAIVTQTWPILFIATPFLIGMVPASYYTHIFRKNVTSLENDIAAPQKIQKPYLNLPVYDPQRDLDLQQTRINVQNTLAQKTLKELAQVSWSNNTLINYALLDRVTVLTPEKRPVFYAKTIQLIEAYGEIVKEHNSYLSQARREFDKLDNELRSWKREQDSLISSAEYNLLEAERFQTQIDEARRRGEPAPVRPAGHFLNTISRWELDSQRSRVGENYGRRDAQNNTWYESTMNNINVAFSIAIAELERQYATAKA